MAAGVLFVGACSGSHEPAQDRPKVSPAPLRNDVGLDVPGIINLSIDQLSQRLGPRWPLPAGFVDPVQAPLLLHQGQIDSVRFFQYRGLAVVAAYNERTRRVTDLLLLGTDESELMRRANLALAAPDYLVLPVFDSQSYNQLLGLRVLATSAPLP